MSTNTIMESLALGLDDYITKTLRKNRNNENLAKALENWRDLIMKKCKNTLETYMQNHPDVSEPPFHLRSRIKKLQEHFVIVGVDKAGHNLALVCKHWYLYWLSKELDSKAYEIVDKSLEQILKEHEKWNKKHDYKHYDTLSYLYGSPKMNKNPVVMRFIAGITARIKESLKRKNAPASVSQIFYRPPHQACNSTSSASIDLSQQLQLVMDILLIQDQKTTTKQEFENVG